MPHCNLKSLEPRTIIENMPLNGIMIQLQIRGGINESVYSYNRKSLSQYLIKKLHLITCLSKTLEVKAL
jgi:hypothetical protein